MVWELYERLETEKRAVPLVGLGGIAYAEDALEFLMAGAAAVQVGSATFARPAAMPEIIEGIENYMLNAGIAAVQALCIRQRPVPSTFGSAD
jgi:dihydroorotate dehydrogenase (NAD+) catalytic subunit